ncbi:MAG: hypothetical protein PVH77_00200 [Phycisphaerales bacterium]|jgi:hypothetical protein
MSLVRWFRKNNKKVMAVVVIVIMFGFIGGGTLLQQLSQRNIETVAYFADNKKITNLDLATARQELDILRTLRADDFLRSQDLNGIFLSELLFAEQRTSPEFLDRIRRAIRTNRFRVSDKQINDMYRRTTPSLYWLLLKAEARRAGVELPNEQAGSILGQIIPQLFQGQTYSQLMGSLINRYGIPERQLLEKFGQLLAVWQYSQMICSNEEVTNSQLAQTIAFEREGISAELVEFDSALFVEDEAQPDEEKVLEHFEKYKKSTAGEVSEENPYGFGYKLPDRVQLEYIAVKLDDISPLVRPPTSEEKEDYYHRHREQDFAEQIRSDPNDPNSPLTSRIKTYAEVIDIISQQILKDRINSTANRILQEAKTLAESEVEDAEIEPADMTIDWLKENTGDYEAIAGQLSRKHNVKLYRGETGLLSPVDMQADEYFARLYLEGYGRNPIPLAQIVFAIDDLSVTELGLYDVPKPQIYRSIGPLKDFRGSAWSGRRDASGQIMAIVRIIKTIKTAEPESIDQTYSIKPIEFDPNQADAEDNIYSVRENVVEDYEKLAAMDITKKRAEEFIELAKKDGWDIAVDRFNELYGEKNSQDPNDDMGIDKPFRLQNPAGLQRIPLSLIQTLAIHYSGRPTGELILNERENYRRFVEKLYSYVPADSNTADDVPFIMEFKPDLSFYCVKSVSVKRVTLEEFQKIRTELLQRESQIQSQSLAAIHFNPENVLKRMNFKAVGADEEQTEDGMPADDTDTPVESEETS